jgi:phage FluMu gp28-like protein
MAKVDIDLVKMVIARRKEIDVNVKAAVIEDIIEEMNLQTEDKEKPPQQKKQFVVYTKEGCAKLLAEAKDSTGWLLQILEEESPASCDQKIANVMNAFNATPKGRRMPIKTLGDAFEYIPAKFFKEETMWVKTKRPIWINVSSNT